MNFTARLRFADLAIRRSWCLDAVLYIIYYASLVQVGVKKWQEVLTMGSFTDEVALLAGTFLGPEDAPSELLEWRSRDGWIDLLL